MIRVYVDRNPVVVCNSWLSVLQMISGRAWRRVAITQGELNVLAHVVLE